MKETKWVIYNGKPLEVEIIEESVSSTGAVSLVWRDPRGIPTWTPEGKVYNDKLAALWCLHEGAAKHVAELEQQIREERGDEK